MALKPLSEVLTIVESDDANRMYIMQVGGGSSSSSSSSGSSSESSSSSESNGTTVPENSVGEVDSGGGGGGGDVSTDLLMTGVLNGNEKFIRYYQGEITVACDNTVANNVWLRPVNYFPVNVRSLDTEIRKFLKEQGKEL
ncbi:MAG: hypothetical protein MJZ34_02310 [Paludibacteraceae bacterium]|nr:hypothetical protein [Paludibacteraceae bacterium]